MSAGGQQGMLVWPERREQNQDLKRPAEAQARTPTVMQSRDLTAVEDDVAVRRLLAGDEVEQRGLAGPGGVRLVCAVPHARWCQAEL